ncbi:MAG: chemotaxis protein CheX, partial [Spirochaetaceae bacterium]|nr:chemotaxis protein CheX [Spirochaetaceae bacterium]
MKNKNTDYLENSLKDFLVDAGFSSSITPIDEITDKANVMATVGITGDKVGFLTLSMELNNAVKLSRGFAELMEIPINSKEFSDSHIEALSELSNQIAGRVVMYMEDNDLNCSITPPTVLSGGNISI